MPPLEPEQFPKCPQAIDRSPETGGDEEWIQPAQPRDGCEQVDAIFQLEASKAGIADSFSSFGVDIFMPFVNAEVGKYRAQSGACSRGTQNYGQKAQVALSKPNSETNKQCAVAEATRYVIQVIAKPRFHIFLPCQFTVSVVKKSGQHEQASTPVGPRHGPLGQHYSAAKRHQESCYSQLVRSDGCCNQWLDQSSSHTLIPWEHGDLHLIRCTLFKALEEVKRWSTGRKGV